MRIEYCEQEDHPGQFNLYHANCARSLGGRKGQAALRELEAALVALPTKRLIANALVHEGDVCAIGALALKRGVLSLGEEDEGEEMVDVGESLGMPRLVAWKVVEANDIDNETYSVRAPGPNQYQWPEYTPGYRLSVHTTPEERYVNVLKWVRANLSGGSPKTGDGK